MTGKEINAINKMLEYIDKVIRYTKDYSFDDFICYCLFN